MKIPRLVWAACGAAALAPIKAQTVAAEAKAPVVMRCPGPPVLYADKLSEQEARSRNCKPVLDLPVAQAPSPAVRAATAPSAAALSASSAAMSGETAGPAVHALGDSRVRRDEQRLRDAQARLILEAELRREEARLAEALKAAKGAGSGGDRSAADLALVRRAESDIEAIRRELARLR
jgi:hypothetical protein